MGYNVALVFRDNVVHKLEIGEDIQVAQELLYQIKAAVHSGSTHGAKTFIFKNNFDKPVFMCNLDNFMFAIIEEKKDESIN